MVLLTMLLELKYLDIPPRQKNLLQEVNWLDFEKTIEELGEHRCAKIAYNNKHLEIMTPLPKHESNKLFITNFIEILLEELEIEFYPLGSTTFKNHLMQSGIEPDNCFYIEKVEGRNKTMKAFRSWIQESFVR